MDVLIAACGWGYVVAWSVFPWAQVVQNFVRGDVRGLSVEFVVSNLISYIGYSLFTCLLYSSETCKLYWRARYDTDPSVGWHDVVFALHGGAVSLVAAAQLVRYRHTISERCGMGASKWTAYGALCAALVLCYFVVDWPRLARAPPPSLTLFSLLPLWLFLEIEGNSKTLLTFPKYHAQLAANAEMRSTTGQSWPGVALDTTGCALALGELVLVSYHVTGTMELVFDNLPKAGLALVSLVYNLLYCYQRFVLYADDERREAQLKEYSRAELLRDVLESSVSESEPDDVSPRAAFKVK